MIRYTSHCQQLQGRANEVYKWKNWRDEGKKKKRWKNDRKRKVKTGREEEKIQ